MKINKPIKYNYQPKFKNKLKKKYFWCIITKLIFPIFVFNKIYFFYFVFNKIYLNIYFNYIYVKSHVLTTLGYI